MPPRYAKDYSAPLHVAGWPAPLAVGLRGADLFVDSCITCFAFTRPLVLARDDEHDAVVGCYRCKCGAAWWTSYGLSEAELKELAAVTR
jgi:hypothetical protein